jgi:integrase
MAWARERRGAKGAKRYQGTYRDPSGAKRSVGTFSSRKAALDAARDAERSVERGEWIDLELSRVTFADYVEQSWWPHLHVEVTTRVAYRSYLDKHFLPAFGPIPLYKITPAMVQTWVSQAAESGLAPRTVAKYHTMLHGIFTTAVRDRVLARNPCDGTRLPKAVAPTRRILSPEEFDTVLAEIPDRWTPLVLTAIETGMRWGELVALRPRHIDWQSRTITVQETVVETASKHSPTGQRIFVKPYPKDNEPRTITISPGLLEVLSARIADYGLGPDDYLFPSLEGPSDYPVSRNTFRTRVWLPAVKDAGLDFNVRMHDLRHAHASWLLAGGADLPATMQRLGHRQLATTQRYIHTLPDADQRALDAYTRIRRRPVDSPQGTI